MSPELIPSVDPSGLPGPVWLFQFLLVLTFFLHILFLNLTLGGSILAAVAQTLGGGREDDPRTRLASRLTGVNGFAISLTITTGVAPLLFIQLLYQQFFYAATILLGWIWFWLLILLTIGYYAVYLHKLGGGGGPRKGSGLLWVAAVLFLLIAGIHVAVNLVHSQPGTWQNMAGSSWAFLADPTYVPRLLHFVFAGIAFSALVMVWWSVRQVGRGADIEANRAMAAFAWKWALWSTAAQVVDGFVFLMLIPSDILVPFMRGGAATMGPLTLGIILAVGILFMLARVKDPCERPALVNGTLATMVGAILVMIVTRHQVRGLSLAEVADLGQYTVRPQWGNFALFAVILFAGLATVYWMVRKVLNEPATGADAA